jgi:hypothetical protein
MGRDAARTAAREGVTMPPSTTPLDPMLVLALHRRSFGTIRPALGAIALAALAPTPPPAPPLAANRATRRRTARLAHASAATE